MLISLPFVLSTNEICNRTTGERQANETAGDQGGEATARFISGEIGHSEHHLQTFQVTMTEMKIRTTDCKTGKPRWIWSSVMDDHLIEAFLHQQVIGNRVNGVWTLTAYKNVQDELTTKFETDIDKTKLKNRLKTLKSNFSEVHDIFKRWSGFSWNPVSMLMEAEQEVWDALVEAKPSASKWITTPITNYEKLFDLFSKDRATGEGAFTAKERRKVMDSSLNTIDDIDNLVSQQEVSLEGFELTQFSPHEKSFCSIDQIENDVHVKVPKGSKRKRVNKDDDEITVIKQVFSELTQVIREGNEVCKNQVTCYSPEHIYEELERMELDESTFATMYMFLIENPSKATALLGCPLRGRKLILDKMIAEVKI